MTNWLDEVFAVRKPVIAMLHLSALPGDPGFDSAAGIRAVVDRARGELAALQEGGVDGVMISNEFSLPYLTKTEPITAIAMARIIGELLPDFSVPYGVNVLWDGRASIDLAVATGAQWVREIFTGVYASDFGLWNTNVGEVARHRHRIGGDGVKLLFNIVPESAVYLADRDLASVTATTVFAGRYIAFQNAESPAQVAERQRNSRHPNVPFWDGRVNAELKNVKNSLPCFG